jgi:microcystin-dependent protein
MIVAGSGMLWFTDAPPTHFLIANGSAVSRNTYSVLFGILGTTYGVGDGSTTFNLPDFKGRTLIGSGTGAGLTPRSLADKVGTETHTLSVAELAGHAHQEKGGNNQDAYERTTTGSSSNVQLQSGSAGTSLQQTGSAGSDSSHNNMQPSLCVNLIIAYEDVSDIPEPAVISWETGQFEDFLNALTVAP